MNNVHNHSNSHLMSGIDQCFQFVGSTKTGRSSKKAGYMIAETSIIRMFLNGHNLDTVIPFFSDTGKYFLAEFVISAHFFLPLCHSDMTFINQQWIRVRLECFLFEFIGFLRSPDLRTEYLGLFILHHTSSPCRNTLALSAFPVYIQFVEIAMMNGIRRQVNFPIAIL